MAYAVYLGQLAFQKVDAHGIPVGDQEIVQRGGRVPDYVRPFEISALTAAGAIVNLGDESDQDRAKVADRPATLPNPEVPPTVVGNPVMPGFNAIGDDLAAAASDDDTPAEAERRNEAERQEFAAGTADTHAIPTEAAPSKPGARDSKQAWEDYAEHVGIDRAEAESLTKQELIARVEAREAS